MRILLPLALFVLTLGVATPAATADHVGPCWHEYAEAALYGATHPREAVGVLLDTVYGCTDARELCRYIDPCILP